MLCLYLSMDIHSYKGGRMKRLNLQSKGKKEQFYQSRLIDGQNASRLLKTQTSTTERTKSCTRLNSPDFMPNCFRIGNISE